MIQFGHVLTFFFLFQEPERTSRWVVSLVEYSSLAHLPSELFCARIYQVRLSLCMPCFADSRFLHKLVHMTGVMYFTNMKNLHEDEWERTVDVNCKGTMFGIGAVLGGMVERGSGHIVNISSDAGRRIFPSLAVYCASKYFVEAMSEGLRRELVGTGLRVTTIQPGDCATDLVMNNTDKEAAEEQGVTIGVKVGTGSTENQVLQPKDIAAAVLYAVSAPSHVAINEVLVEPRDQT